jgi:ribosome-associated heat shock protein Hsp15
LGGIPFKHSLPVAASGDNGAMEKMRIDKWLWAARFYKTRSLASEDIDKGRVEVNGQTAKPAREVKPGDTVLVRQGAVQRIVVIVGLSAQRGPAPVAQGLYQETAGSIEQRAKLALQQRYAREPALSQEQGRPTKRDRRELEQARHGWDERWSASVDK